MHYLAILTVILAVTFATGGHSETFGDAYKAATRGDVSEAIDLLSTAVRRTLRDADTPEHRNPAPAELPVLP